MIRYYGNNPGHWSQKGEFYLQFSDWGLLARCLTSIRLIFLTCKMGQDKLPCRMLGKFVGIHCRTFGSVLVLNECSIRAPKEGPVCPRSFPGDHTMPLSCSHRQPIGTSRPAQHCHGLSETLLVPRSQEALEYPLHPWAPMCRGKALEGALIYHQDPHSQAFNIENTLRPLYTELLFVIIAPSGIFPHCFLQSCFKLLH